MSQPAPDSTATPSPASPRRRPPHGAAEPFAAPLGAAVATLLFHFALYGVARHTTLLNFTVEPHPALRAHGTILRADRTDKPVPAHLLPPSMRPTPPRFVEVNPLAPTAKPDHARNTGAADQRAAQPEPDARKSGDLPRVPGTEKNSTRVVNGIPRELLPKELRPAPGQPVGRDTAPPPKPNAKADATKAAPQGPLAEGAGPRFTDKKTSGKTTDKTDPKSTGKTDRPTDKKTGPEKAKKRPALAVDSPDGDDIPDTPAARPKATFAGTTGPLGLTLGGANEKGVLAPDSRFSRMGEYSARLFEIIQTSWWAAIDRARIAERGQVVVEFTLHRDGSVSDARIISSSASDRAAILCLDAIVGRSPYEKWPEDMIAMFGDKQEGRITFTYY